MNETVIIKISDDCVMNDDDDLRRDDQYKQVFWSGVSHINMCEGIGVEITKNVRERDEDGWEGKKEGKRGK